MAIDVCNNSTASDPFDVGVWHDRGHGPSGGTVYGADVSDRSDERAGTNGTYGTGCGPGNNGCGEIGLPRDDSDAHPDMEVAQNASIGVDDLHLEKGSSGSVILRWSEPAHDATIHVTRFHLYRLDPVTLEWALMAEIPRSATSFQDPSPNDVGTGITR
ncbi:MAG TPA: hypothetical protein VFV75_00370 [Candidatus Polarisedimenticolaceae bacterium]|nr:hypothetical protein [Candidatus Polarisedimenticolaceae bacterium]